MLYAVVHTAMGWSVVEDGRPVEFSCDKPEAVEIAHRLISEARTAGRTAKLLVESDCGRLETWDVDQAVVQLDAIFAESARRRGRASV